MQAEAETETPKQESERLLNFLAGLPSGNCVASSAKVVREIMLQTSGTMMAHGHLWDVHSQALGGDVHRMTLRRHEFS